MTVKDIIELFDELKAYPPRDESGVVVTIGEQGNPFLCIRCSKNTIKCPNPMWAKVADREIDRWFATKNSVYILVKPIVVEPIDPTEALNEKEQIAKSALSDYEREWIRLPASSQKDDIYRKTRDIKDYLKAIDTIRDIEDKHIF